MGYLAQPTPGAQNRVALAQIGPAILSVADNPPAPAPGQDLVVTAEVAPTLAPIRSVKLFCRINYLPDMRGLPSGGIAMLDDGQGADAVARDGIYTAVIPSQFYGRADMVRWYVKAEDTAGHASRDPLFPYPDNAPEYYGTVVQDSRIASALPILYWFVEDPAAASTRTGARGSLFFDGEFYDNIFIRRRGGATVGAASKKFVFNNGGKFRFSDDYDRVKEFNFNQNGSDPSYLRQPLAFETIRKRRLPLVRVLPDALGAQWAGRARGGLRRAGRRGVSGTQRPGPARRPLQVRAAVFDHAGLQRHSIPASRRRRARTRISPISGPSCRA